jgi:hypothetical protein
MVVEIPSEIKAKPAAACRSPRSPAKAATSGPRSAGRKRVVPITRSVQSNSGLRDRLEYPKKVATLPGLIMRTTAAKKKIVAPRRRVRAARRINMASLTREIFWVDLIQEFSEPLNLLVGLRTIFLRHLNTGLR